LNSRAIAELPQVLAASASMSDAETQLLDALYRGAIDESELTRALQLVQDMFQCRSGAFVSFDARAPAADLSMVSGIFNEYGRLYLEQFVAIDPAPLFFSRLATGTASTSDRVLSEEERNALPFFNEFFRPIGLTETLAGNLFNDRGRFSLIGLQRGDDRPPFDDDDIARMEQLMPHVTRAVQLRRTFVRLEAQNRALQAAIDRLPTGLVVLDSDGGAIFVNATMQALAKRADGLSLDRSGRPLLANLTARRRFDALLHDVSKGGAGGVLSAPRTSGARDYAVLVSPSPASLAHLQWDKPGIAGSLVLVHDPDSRSQAPPHVLERALNLPKGAAKLVAALAADEDLKSFAEREGITIHTVRFHLHTALARTGTRNQAELVRIAVRLLRDFALAES
jgi:PAS domain-containing protein